MRFPEEQSTLVALLKEWYDAIEAFTLECNGVFSDKAKQYDQLSPVWHRLEWPHSFVGEVRKKNDRISQLLANYDPKTPTTSVDWSEVNEELADIVNYARMMAGLNDMVKDRSDG